MAAGLLVIKAVTTTSAMAIRSPATNALTRRESARILLVGRTKNSVERWVIAAQTLVIQFA